MRRLFNIRANRHKWIVNASNDTIQERYGKKRIVLCADSLFAALVAIPHCLVFNTTKLLDAADALYANIPEKYTKMFVNTKERMLKTDPMQFIRDLRNYFSDLDMYATCCWLVCM
jgi:hypothetical protein